MSRKVAAVAGAESVVLPGGWVLDGGDQVVVDDNEWALISEEPSLVLLLVDLGVTTDALTPVPSVRDVQQAASTPVAAPVVLAPGPWTAITSFGSSVSAYSGTIYFTPQCRLDISGTRIELRGALVVSGNVYPGSTSLTLPVGFRPTKTIGLGIFRSYSSSGATVGPSLSIASTGVALSGPGGLNSSDDPYLLDGISFAI